MKGKTGIYIDSAIMPLLNICSEAVLGNLFSALLQSTDPGYSAAFDDEIDDNVRDLLTLIEDGGFVKYDFGDLVIPECKERLRIEKNEQK